MRLTLQRDYFEPNSTLGFLSIPDPAGVMPIVLSTLEPPSINGLPGSCIPPGVYVVKRLPSAKFLRSKDPWVLQRANLVPHILGIQLRSDILIHWGNYPEDTDGCILIGMNRYVDEQMIQASRQAYTILMSMWADPCFIEVIGGAIQSGVATA